MCRIKGNNTETTITQQEKHGLGTELEIPTQYIVQNDQVMALVNLIFPELGINVGKEDYFDWITERAIIAPTNSDVDLINQICLNRLPGQEVSLLSWDVSSNEDDILDRVPVDLLHTLNEGGLPPHNLKLKIGAPVTLLRNLCPAEGHCNGTRYVVTKINPNTLESTVAAGARKGELYVVPRVPLFNTKKNTSAIRFKRKQFPVKLSFAFTAHKAQGQSLNHVGVCAKKDFFTHGQLYVAVSRATQPDNLHILLRSADTSTTSNVVYEEIL